MASDSIKPPIYLKCSVKKKVFSNGGSVLKLGVKADDLREFLAQHTNDRGWINFDIKERREMGKYGDTHLIQLDQWVAPAKAEPPDIPF
jgi:hypothetical protein